MSTYLNQEFGRSDHRGAVTVELSVRRADLPLTPAHMAALQRVYAAIEAFLDDPEGDQPPGQ